MTQVILLEKIEKLGDMGDTVNVRPGFARNFLLPQNKALRASESNLAYFESQKANLEKANAEKKKTAETHASSLKNVVVTLIRQAGESGQLYGSVTARDVADAINDTIENKIERNMVDLNIAIKEIGLFDVTVALHPEVKREVKINIARTEDEAKTQLKTGNALINSNDAPANNNADNTVEEAANESKEALMDGEALVAEKEAEAKAAEAQAKKDATAQAKAEKEAAKAAAAAPEEETEEDADTAA